MPPLSPETLDPREHAFRPDLADARLRDQVSASHYKAHETYHVTAPETAQLSAPEAQASAGNCLLFGEHLEVLETRDGYAWGRTPESHYVGWVHQSDLAPGTVRASHFVGQQAVHVFSEPSIKSPPVLRLGRFSQVVAPSREGEFWALEGGGYIHRGALIAAETRLPDWLSIASAYIGTPYLWGGRGDLGIDCSGLVQVALQSAGILCPRDSDLQEQRLGEPIGLDPEHWQAGDLLFWPGHVGIHAGSGQLLHATARVMQVVAEPLDFALDQIKSAGLSLREVKRIRKT